MADERPKKYENFVLDCRVVAVLAEERERDRDGQTSSQQTYTQKK